MVLWCCGAPFILWATFDEGGGLGGGSALSSMWRSMFFVYLLMDVAIISAGFWDRGFGSWEAASEHAIARARKKVTVAAAAIGGGESDSDEEVWSSSMPNALMQS